LYYECLFRSKIKAVANELSQLLKKDEFDTNRAVELMALLGYQPAEQMQSNQFDEFEIDRGHVGIYKPEDGPNRVNYIRDVAMKDIWSFCADVHIIPPKKGKRAVLLGESVARGFLLDPYLTPAMVVEKTLHENCTDDQFDVVDLAETNLGIRGLMERYVQCFQLDPDVIIFFAGNNWRDAVI
jgi:hypothetical protein